MRRAALLFAALLLAGQAYGQAAIDVAKQTVSVDGTDAPSYSTMAAPAGCTASSVALFLGSPVAMGCDAGISYDATTDKMKLGSNVSSGDDAALLFARAATNPIATGGSHAIRDESTYVTATPGGYASFDSIPAYSGAGAHNHLHSFQSRPFFNGSNGIGAVRGFTFQLNGTWSGTMGQAAGLYVADSLGTGTLTVQAGLFVEELTKGVSNYAIYSNGANTPSYHAGFFQTGAGITAAGLLKGQNFQTNTAVASVRVGDNNNNLGALNTYIGHLAANSSNGSDQKNVCVGTRSGNAIVAGSSNVFLGYNSGYYETGSNTLMIDNAPRTNAADARIKALIYGGFDASPINQYVTINGSVRPTTLQGGAVKTLTESAATEFVYVTIPSSGAVSGRVVYTVFAKDASNTQAKSGELFLSAVANSSGTVTAATLSDVNTQNPCSSGTLTNTMTQDVATANTIKLSANAVSSLTQTTLEVRYRVELSGGTATVTPQ